MKVAVVDDEKLFREYLVYSMDWEALESQVCWQAKDGEEALEKAQQEAPDLILVDINMPFMDGLTFTERVKSLLPEVEIVLVTGIETFDCARKAIQLGVRDYLLKPFSNQEFHDTLKKIQVAFQARTGPTGVKAFYPWEFYKGLLRCLRTGQRAEIVSQLEWLFDDMQAKAIDREFMQTTIQTLVALCLSHLTESGRGIEEAYGKEFRPSDVLSKMGDLNQVKQATLKLFDDTLSIGKEKKLLRSNQIVERTLLLIHEGFANEDLSLTYLSQSVYVNESYLRSIFKKNVGMTISDYLTQVRMNEARRLIEAGGMKFSEICHMVGYRDPAYFSKCFKRFFGVSPSSFENMREKYKMQSDSTLSL